MDQAEWEGNRSAMTHARRFEPDVTADDELLFGWNPTPGIVSVWADRGGQALVWQRVDDRVTCRRDRFRPWLFAATLDDLAYLRPQSAPADGPSIKRVSATARWMDHTTHTAS